MNYGLEERIVDLSLLAGQSAYSIASKIKCRETKNIEKRGSSVHGKH